MIPTSLKKMIDFTSSRNKVNVLCIAIFVCVLALISFGQVSYNDFWWHLSLGKWMFQNHAIMTHDVFSYTFAGGYWLNNTWLFDGMVYLIYLYSAHIGLNALRFVLISAGYYFFIKTALIKKNEHLVLTLALFLFTLPLLRNFIRPEIASPLFAGYFLFALYAYKYRHLKFIYALPLVEIIWSNAHGSFELGILLVGIFFGSEVLRSFIRHKNIIRTFSRNTLARTYGIILVLVCAVTLVTPYGYDVYGFVSKMLNDTDTLNNITEWFSTPLANLVSFPSNASTPVPVLAWIAAVVLAYKLVLLCRSKKYKLLSIIETFFFEDTLLFIIFLLSAFKYNRGMYIFVLIAALITAKNVTIVTQLKKKEILAQVAFFAALFFIIFFAGSISSLNIGPSSIIEARESIAFLKKANLQGNMLNEYADGSSLIWQLYPQYKVFIDGRAANLYDSYFFWYYRAIADSKTFQKAVKKYDISFIVFPATSSFANMLSESKEWSLVFFDNYESVYMTASKTNDDIIKNHTYAILNPGKALDRYLPFCKEPKAKANLFAEISRNMHELEHPLYAMTVAAKLLHECDGHTQDDLKIAEQLMHEVMLLQNGNNTYLDMLGMIQIDRDENSAAADTFKQSIAIEKNKQSMTGLGIALYNLGLYKKADAVFSKVPFLPGQAPNEYYQTYARTSYQLDHNQKSIELMHHYLALIDPEKITPQDYLDLSRAYADNGQPDLAAQYLEKSK